MEWWGVNTIRCIHPFDTFSSRINCLSDNSYMFFTLNDYQKPWSYQFFTVINFFTWFVSLHFQKKNTALTSLIVVSGIPIIRNQGATEDDIRLHLELLLQLKKLQNLLPAPRSVQGTWCEWIDLTSLCTIDTNRCIMMYIYICLYIIYIYNNILYIYIYIYMLCMICIYIYILCIYTWI